jgi:hypothetical protein
MALRNIGRKGSAAAAVIGLGALLVGCSASARPDSNASFGPAAAPAAPLAVSCEPNQRALVRQVAINGALQAQVQCETVAPGFAATGTTGYAAASPVAYQPGFQPVSYAPAPLDNTRIVRTAYPQQVVTREAAPRRVTSYQPAQERVIRQPKRSVKKSAVIIGSSAGVGAGIGAAIGGKKGAGIGALLGGGGAALWDQMTRRKQ